MVQDRCSDLDCQSDKIKSIISHTRGVMYSQFENLEGNEGAKNQRARWKKGYQVRQDYYKFIKEKQKDA